MKIVINLKPVIVKARTRRELVNKIGVHSGFHHVVAGGKDVSFNALMKTDRRNSDNAVVRVYNLEKRRKKVERLGHATLAQRSGKRPKLTSRVIEPAHWVAYVYTLPRSVVAEARQYARNFTLKLKVA